MVFHVRKWMGRFRFLLLFATFTFVIYHLLVFFKDWIEPLHRYREPNGQAVKVFQHDKTSLIGAEDNFGERLKLFYWIGE